MNAQRKALILNGCIRENSNTEALLGVFREEFSRLTGSVPDEIRLAGADIGPCTACRYCQKDWSKYTCSQRDDMDWISGRILDADLLIAASPIHFWYAAPPLMSAMDRLAYSMDMYYGGEKGPAFLEGKSLCAVTSCGYPVSKGSDLWEEGMKRAAKHMKMRWLGILTERHMGYDIPFMDEKKEEDARAFAHEIFQKWNA